MLKMMEKMAICNKVANPLKITFFKNIYIYVEQVYLRGSCNSELRCRHRVGYEVSGINCEYMRLKGLTSSKELRIGA